MNLRITAHTIQEATQGGLEHVTIIRTDVDPRPLLAALPRVCKALEQIVDQNEYYSGGIAEEALELFGPTATPEQSSVSQPPASELP